MTATNPEPHTRMFRSYEELERELMPNRAKSRRPDQGESDFGARSLEILRRSIAEATGMRND